MKERIIFYSDRKTYWLHPDDICCIEGAGSYTNINHLNGQVIKISKNLKTVMEMLPVHCTQFFRVQKSHVVNLNHIEYLYMKNSAKALLHLRNGFEVPISNSDVRSELFKKCGLIGPEFFRKTRNKNKKVNASIPSIGLNHNHPNDQSHHNKPNQSEDYIIINL